MNAIRWMMLVGATGLAGLLASGATAQNSFGQPAQPYSPQPYPQRQPYPPQQQQGGMQQGYPQQQYPWRGQGPRGEGQPGNRAPALGTGPVRGQPSGATDQLTQIERQDFGVAPTAELHDGAMHGPTPASIPGGQVITTRGLIELIRGRQMPVLILDVLGGPERIPGAQYAVPAHQPGSFNDQTQRQFGQYLERATGGNREYPLVLYCQSPQCWMSYNAALRAIRLGYTNVLWYRGGIESWKQARQQVQDSR